jgi:hypothetical protein
MLLQLSPRLRQLDLREWAPVERTQGN